MLTDVVMPQMGGRELADCLRPRMPRLKVLFTSGFPGQARVPEGYQEPGIAFLPKPYTPEVLARKMREVLDTPSQAA